MKVHSYVLVEVDIANLLWAFAKLKVDAGETLRPLLQQAEEQVDSYLTEAGEASTFMIPGDINMIAPTVYSIHVYAIGLETARFFSCFLKCG